MTRHGRNFTAFSNVWLKGSPTSAPKDGGMLEMGSGATNAASTITISQISGSTLSSPRGAVEVPYLHISNAGLSLGTGYIRINAYGSGKATTLSISSVYDSDYALKLPAASGGLPVCGTFSFSMPAIAVGAFGETSVAVTGCRADSAFVCTLQDTFNTVTTDRGSAALIGAAPGNGYAHLTFFNFGLTATIPNTLIGAYAMFR